MSYQNKNINSYCFEGRHYSRPKLILYIDSIVTKTDRNLLYGEHKAR